jgi:hypothetical protein
VLIGGHRTPMEGALAGGYYFQPTVLKEHNKMRVFQEEIFGPVLAVTTFRDEAEALEIANDTMYGLGARGRPRFVIDVSPGAAEGFSLEGLDGIHFVTRTAVSSSPESG